MDRIPDLQDRRVRAVRRAGPRAGGSEARRGGGLGTLRRGGPGDLRRSGRPALRRVIAALLPLALLAGAGCEPGAAREAGPGADRGDGVPVRAAEVGDVALDPIPDSAFGRMVRDLSGPGAYFDTDNLISNESSYLHVLDGLERRGIRGGAYLGVGPDQNFSYIARVRPDLALLVDIRRDNLLQHLWLKALFHEAGSRLDYLCLMVSRACGGPSGTLSIGELVERVEGAPRVADPEAAVRSIVEAVQAAAPGVPLDDADRALIAQVHARFASDGLGLRFNTHGRAPQPYYPTLRQLLLERDRAGEPGSYLAAEEDFRFVAGLQRANRVVPVVGDLAGPVAVPAIGDELRRRGLRVSAFYVSNVEFYLVGEGTFPRFVENLDALPVRDDAVLIRSYFNRFRPIEETVPGYASTQLLQEIPALVDDWSDGRIRSYGELIARSSGG